MDAVVELRSNRATILRFLSHLSTAHITAHLLEDAHELVGHFFLPEAGEVTVHGGGAMAF